MKDATSCRCVGDDQRKRSDRVTVIVVDGRQINGEAGQNLVDLLRNNSIEIPAACHGWGTGDRLHCRLCLVEIDGQPELRRACTEEVSDGMVVRTATPAIRNARRANLQGLFEQHYREELCQECIWNGGCILHQLAEEWGIRP